MYFFQFFCSKLYFSIQNFLQHEKCIQVVSESLQILFLAYAVEPYLNGCPLTLVGALALDILIFALVDLVMFERHFRYVFTPYIVLAIALTGSMSKNWDDANSNTIFTVAIACMAFVLFCVKVIMCVVKSRIDPIFSGSPKAMNAI